MDFVEEVEDQLRAERYATFARRYLRLFVAALVATVVGWLGVWGYDAWRDRNIGRASIAYENALVSLSKGDATGAYNGFGAIAKDGPSAYRTLSLMQQANIRFSENNPGEAVTLYDAAAKAAPNAIFADLARLRAAQVAMDTAPLPQIETRLKALTGDKHPYSLAARELLAMAELQGGRAQQARGDFNAISLTLGVSPGMRARAQGAIALIDSGQAALVGEVVKAAATMPPPIAGTAVGLPGAPSSAGEADAQGQDGPAQQTAQTPAGNAQ